MLSIVSPQGMIPTVVTNYIHISLCKQGICVSTLIRVIIISPLLIYIYIYKTKKKKHVDHGQAIQATLCSHRVELFREWSVTYVSPCAYIASTVGILSSLFLRGVGVGGGGFIARRCIYKCCSSTQPWPPEVGGTKFRCSTEYLIHYLPYETILPIKDT